MKLWYFSLPLEIRFKLGIIFYRKASKSEAISLYERLDLFFIVQSSNEQNAKIKISRNIRRRDFSEVSMDGFHEATFRPSRKSKEIKRKKEIEKNNETGRERENTIEGL